MLYTAQSMIDAMLHAHFDASTVTDRQRLFANVDAGEPGGRLARRFGRTFLPGLRGFGPGSAFDGVSDVRVEIAR